MPHLEKVWAQHWRPSTTKIKQISNLKNYTVFSLISCSFFTLVSPLFILLCLHKEGIRDFPGGSEVKVPGMRDTRVPSLGREDPLEKEMATHSSTLAWRIPWKEQPGRLQSMGLQRVGHDWATSLHFSEGIRIQQTVLVIDPGWDVTHCTFSAHKIFVTRLKIWGFFFKVRKSTFIL